MVALNHDINKTDILSEFEVGYSNLICDLKIDGQPTGAVHTVTRGKNMASESFPNHRKWNRIDRSFVYWITHNSVLNQKAYLNMI
jgi:hypothetical protein